MEMEIKNGKFWVLEEKTNGTNTQRHIFDDEQSAINKIKQLIKTISVEKLVLLIVDTTGKDWKITPVSWSVIAMGLVREEK